MNTHRVDNNCLPCAQTEIQHMTVCIVGLNGKKIQSHTMTLPLIE